MRHAFTASFREILFILGIFALAFVAMEGSGLSLKAALPLASYSSDANVSTLN